MPNPLVSVVLGSYNRLPFLKLTIESLRIELSQTPHEIMVVDGGSTDGSVPWLISQKDIISLIQHNRGHWRGKTIERKSWGYFMNLGFRAASGKYVCMVSDDCLIIPGAITKGIKHIEKQAKKQKVGAAAFYWRNWPEQERYWVGTTLGGKLFVNHGLYLKSALAEVGYIDDTTFSFYHADGDLCLKLWHAGYTCIDAPESFVEHYAHANMKVKQSNNTQQAEDWQRYLEKWQNIFYQENSETGGWIEKSYTDPHHTAKQFQKLYTADTYKKAVSTVSERIIRRLKQT